MNVPTEAFRKQFLILIPAYINVFMWGCATGWLSNAIYFFYNGDEISATPFQCSLIASYTELGRILFAIPGGMLLDKFGRKKIIICTGILHFFFWLILSINSSLIAIYVVRFALGITGALVNTTSLIFIGEIASPEIRGRLISFHQISLTAGIISQSIITVLFSSYQMLSYCTTAISAFFFVSMYWIMETPNYLISQSKLHQAKENLKYIRIGYTESDIITEFEKLRKYIEEEKLRKKTTNLLKFMKSKAISQPLITLFSLSFFTGMNGMAAIFVYSTLIFPNVGYVPVNYYPLIFQLLQFIVAICTSLYIDKYSRRSIFMAGSGLMTILMAFCALVNYLWMVNDDDVIFKWLFLFGNILLSIVHRGSVAAICNTLKSEILPQVVKGSGGSLDIIAQGASISVSYQLYHLISNNFSLYYLYVISSIDSIILCILVYFRLPEARGKMLADLQENFKDKAYSDGHETCVKK